MSSKTHYVENGVVVLVEKPRVAMPAGFHVFPVAFPNGINQIQAIALQPEDQKYVEGENLIECTYLEGVDWPVPISMYVATGNIDELASLPPKRFKPKQYCGLICLDGVDASGKTTLANTIAEMTGGEVIHLTWSPELEAVMHQYRTSAIDYAAALGKDRVVVLERPWLSNYVYGAVYRNNETHERILRWKRKAEEQAAVSVYSIPSKRDVWLDNYMAMAENREEMYGADFEAMGSVYDLFLNFFQQGDTIHSKPVSIEGNCEIYDYTAYLNNVELFVTRHILPTLNTK